MRLRERSFVKRMATPRRFAFAAVAVALAGPLLSMPAAHATEAYDCFSGTRTPAQDGYDISARGCGPVSGTNVVIKILSGSAAGAHRCRTAFSWNGFMSAEGCRAA